MPIGLSDQKTALVPLFLAFASLCIPGEALAESHLFDEIRVMPNLDVGNAARRETGAFVNAMVLFDPLDAANATGQDLMLRPRLHIGANISTEGKTSQVYGGLSWKIPLNDLFFVDFGVGGTVHNGRVSNDGPGPDLGCTLLFREYAAIGYQIDPNWSLMATIDHSSHAGLCNRTPNQGITHGGLAIGYKF